MKLLMRAFAKLLSGLLLMEALLFGPAGTWHFPGAWRLLALLFVPMPVVGAVLYRRAPELLRKRLNSREQEPEQRAVILLSSLIFITGFVLAGLDFRFGWTRLPAPVVALGMVLFCTGYGLYVEVLRENAHLSRTVEVQEGQKVIDTGLYGIVRHPMYTSTILLFLAMPLVLGSWVSFAIMLLFPVVIFFRIRNEEKVLEEGLAGYREYKQKVRYRLLPFIW